MTATSGASGAVSEAKRSVAAIVAVAVPILVLWGLGIWWIVSGLRVAEAGERHFPVLVKLVCLAIGTLAVVCHRTFSRSWIVARKEVNLYLTSPIAYVVAFYFLVVNGALFWLIINVYAQEFRAPEGPPYQWIFKHWFFWLIHWVLVPALTMRLISEEIRGGTLEGMLTVPLSGTQFVLGKFFGCVIVLSMLWAGTLLYLPLIQHYQGEGDWVTTGTLLAAIAFILILFILSFSDNDTVREFAGMMAIAAAIAVGIAAYRNDFSWTRDRSVPEQVEEVATSRVSGTTVLVEQTPIVSERPDEERTAADAGARRDDVATSASDVRVTVNGERVRVESVDGARGKIVLAEAPAGDAEVVVKYATKKASWNGLFLALFILGGVLLGTSGLLAASPETDALGWPVWLARGLGCALFIAFGGLFVYRHSPFDYGPVATCYLTAVALGAAITAIGVFFSSLTRDQVIAFIMTANATVFLFVISFFERLVSSPKLKEVIRHMSIIEHMNDPVKGILDTTHFVYYGSIMVFFLFLSIIAVESKRWS